jgi:hypothetical protein
MRLVIVEDGTEYLEFARVFLADYELVAARSLSDALAAAATADRFLIDLRFERAPIEALVGDMTSTAERLFGGDTARALRHLQDQQGTLILAELRRAGHRQPALFVHEFPDRRLQNLRKLYGDVRTVPAFDAQQIRKVLEA